MPRNPGLSLQQLVQYLETPDAQRPFARYRHELLAAQAAFDAQQVARLLEIVAMAVPQYPKFNVGKLLIDLSWASSHLEGNSYTQLDTQVLIEYGKSNADKPAEDAAMILNHKKAIEYMLAHAVVDEESIKMIHKALADNRMAAQSRHFLPPQRCGVIRSYTEDGFYIAGSSYLPPQAEGRSPGYIGQEFTRLLASANALPDAVNQSFFLMTRIPYLQPFYDANKRTARISCNIPLIKNGLAPLSFVDFDKKNYVQGMLAFYELDDGRLARHAWLKAYIASAFRYLPFGEEARFALATQRATHLDAACNYVLHGVRPAHPVWLRRAQS